jgi:two-component system chemotaxis response regulator CheB
VSTSSVEAVVIGASAGALEALSSFLPTLPKDYPLPVMIVVHLPPDKNSVMADLLKSKCKIDVREAEDKEPIRAATVYIAPPDYHLLVEPDRRLSLSSDDPVHFSRPSIDVLFESAADAYGPGLVGLILTGGSSDGANGLRAVHQAGGQALVQDPAKANVPLMPQAALEVCPSARVMSLPEITTFLNHLVQPA